MIHVVNPDCLNNLLIKDIIEKELPEDNYITSCLLVNTAKNNYFENIEQDCVLVGCVNESIYKIQNNFIKKIIPYQNLKTIAAKVDYILYPNSIVVRTNTGCGGQCTYCNICDNKIASYSIEKIIANIELHFDSTIKTIIFISNNNSLYNYEETDIFDLTKIIKDRFKTDIIIQTLSIPFCIKNKSKLLNLLDHNYIKHFGLSVQSGSDSVLAKMNRPYNTFDVIKLMEDINRRKLDCFVYSEFLYGFYGETKRDLNKSLSLAYMFDHVVWYKYRQLNGSLAQKLYSDYYDAPDWSSYIQDFANIVKKKSIIIEGGSFTKDFTKETIKPVWFIKK